MSDERRAGDGADEMAGGGGMLSRWSRRKAAARAGVAPPEHAEPALDEALPAGAPTGRLAGEGGPRPAPADATEAGAGDAAALDDGGEPAPLPTLDDLGDDSDYSAFLREKVPAAVRKQALRKLFSAAKFNVVDGLDDYDDDFREILPLGDIVTSDMKHQAEVEARKAREKAEEEARRAALDRDGEPRQVQDDDEDAEALESDEARPPEDTADAEQRLDAAGPGEPPADSEPAAARTLGEPPVHRGLRRVSGGEVGADGEPAPAPGPPGDPRDRA